MKRLIITCSALILGLSLNAQIQTPSASPTAELKQKVGLTDVSIVYSRPSVKGRIIFGTAASAVVPFDKIWRTGANGATKFSFGDDVKVGGQAIKKGDYAILTMPMASDWKVMLYTYETGDWNSYVEKTPAATFTVKSEKLGAKVETFTIELGNVKSNMATIDVMWDMTKASLPLEVEVDKKVADAIDRVMAGPSANDYAAAANYYHDNKKDLKKALEWIQKANAMDPQFWNLRRESLILADLGKKTEAIAAATKSLDLAKKAKNDDYVKMNELSIAEWKK
jgi:hypothetical protein